MIVRRLIAFFLITLIIAWSNDILHAQGLPSWNGGNRQQPAPFIFEVEPKKLPEFGSNGGSATVKVKSSGKWKISSNPKDGWCKIAQDGSNEIHVTVSKNTSTSPRNDSFTIKQGSKSKTINIQQDGAQGYMYPHTNNINISAEGGVKEVSIVSNLDWLTSGKLDFGTILKEKDKIVIVVAKNDGPERTGYFYVKAKNLESRIKVTQEGSKVKSPMPPIEKNISTNRLEYNASGGTQYVILSDNQWYLSYSNQPSWIKTEKDNGVLIVTVEPNKSKLLRSHSLIVTINGKKELIDIIQESKQAKSDKTSTGKQNKRFSVGLELTGDFNRIWDKSWTLSWGAGLLMKVGNLNDVVNFSAGVRYTMMSYYAYYDPYTLGSYITLPANLKFNTFKVGSGKFYIGAGYEYGFGLKDLEDTMDFNVGIGIHTRHIDWYLYAKDYFKYGDSMKWYFDGRKWRAGTSIAYYF